MGQTVKGDDSTPSSTPTGARDYLFHLDALPERLTFHSRLEMTGWLLHRAGLPISGLRAVIKPRGRSARTYKGRRKRARPALGAAYPHLPDAGMSGFLVEIDDLPLGTYDLTLDVRDHEKAWHTLFRTTASAVPLSIVRRLRFPQLEETLRSKLQRHFPKKTPNLALASGEAEEIRREIAQSLTVEPLPPRSMPVAKVNLFVTSKSNLFIREIGDLVCAGFREAGCESQLLIDQFPEAETDADTLQIVVTPHEFYNLFLTPALAEDEVRRRSQNCFLLGTEQPDSDWFHSNLVVAPHARAMLDINSLGVAGYRACGLRCFHLPLGFHPILRGNHNLPGAIRDLDLCLLASITERREKFLAAHADFFAQRRCHLRLVPLGFAKTETTKSYLPVARRNEILQRSKILLNIHYSELRYFEWHRMLVGLANGCCIVTETCEGFAPLVPGEHFIMVETENLISTCEYYLSHPEERETIAHAGREFVEQHFTQGGNCRELLEQISSGHPHSLGVRPDDRISVSSTPNSGRDRHPFWRAFSSDLGSWFTPPERMPVTSPEDDARTVATIRERRRGYEERFKQQENLCEGQRDAWRIQENESFRRTKAPAVTILITLYNY
ncbi:MAG: glycosyltransferase family protein [Chthoniobacterales bacterium]